MKKYNLENRERMREYKKEWMRKKRNPNYVPTYDITAVRKIKGHCERCEILLKEGEVIMCTECKEFLQNEESDF